jgi:hypothetical protein
MRAPRPARTPSFGATQIMPRGPLTFDAAFVQSLRAGDRFCGDPAPAPFRARQPVQTSSG